MARAGCMEKKRGKRMYLYKQNKKGGGEREGNDLNKKRAADPEASLRSSYGDFPDMLQRRDGFRIFLLRLFLSMLDFRNFRLSFIRRLDGRLGIFRLDRWRLEIDFE